MIPTPIHSLYIPGCGDGVLTPMSGFCASPVDSKQGRSFGGEPDLVREALKKTGFFLKQDTGGMRGI